MKKIILLFLCFAQYGFAAPFSITGKVDKPIVDHLIFYSQNLETVALKSDTIKLNPDGSFSHILEISDGKFLPIYIKIDSLREANVLGFGNSSLKISFALGNREAVFDGPMAKIQRFEADDSVYWRKIYASYLKRNPNFKKKEFLHTDYYFEIQDSITNDRINYLRLYFKDTDKQPEVAFLNYRITSFIYSDLFYKQSYPNADFNKYKFYQDKFGPTYKYSDMVSFNDPDLCNIESYRRFVNSFLLSELYRRRQKNNIKFHWPELIPDSFKLIDELSSNPDANNGIKIAFLVYLIEELEREKDIARAIQMQEEIKTLKLWLAKPIQQINARLMILIKNHKFKKGSPAPDFEFTDMLKNKIKLADFKGKRLVIDVAASWCGPCIEGIPAWNRKVEENNNAETIYIFLSLDNTIAESLVFFKQHQPKGKLLFAGNGGFKSRFAKDYEISVLPKQIIIDSEGKLESYAYN